jgi:hypothetical protein
MCDFVNTDDGGGVEQVQERGSGQVAATSIDLHSKLTLKLEQWICYPLRMETDHLLRFDMRHIGVYKVTWLASSKHTPNHLKRVPRNPKWHFIPIVPN